MMTTMTSTYSAQVMRKRSVTFQLFNCVQLSVLQYCILNEIPLYCQDAEAARVREERLQAYAAKKSKKPALIAKSSILLDVKPWDDETDMKEMEKLVRTIEMDGLLWGASKLVPVGYGINKLQIMCVIEDDKVSVDLLTEKIQENEDFVQSVDIAAFNKI